MKKDIHPNYHTIKVEMTDGKQKLMDKGRISKFNKKFQNFKSEKSS